MQTFNALIGDNLVYLIIYSFAFGILSSFAANSKNRNEIGWFILGFIFGIFGLLAVILVKEIIQGKNLDKSEDNLNQIIVTKKCPDCAETIKIEAKICRFCRHIFNDEEIRAQIKSAEEQLKMVTQKKLFSSDRKGDCIGCLFFDQSKGYFNSHKGFCKIKKDITYSNWGCSKFEIK